MSGTGQRLFVDGSTGTGHEDIAYVISNAEQSCGKMQAGTTENPTSFKDKKSWCPLVDNFVWLRKM
jgi:hypothetical protein